MTRFRMLCLACLFPMLATTDARSQASDQWRAMNQPVEPFRILDNLYYVGASSVTAYLITTDQGHILIDGGFAETAPMILASIRELGFEPEDVKILLNSHGHFDHAGGLAALKEATGARFLASHLEAPLLERGGLGDDIIGDDGPYPPIAVDRRLEHGDVIELGEMRLTAHVTAGHTRGCTSWSFEVGGHLAVSTCSLSILPGTRLLDEATYPGIARDYAASIRHLRTLPAELFLASHAGVFEMKRKRLRQEAGDREAFVDPEGYRSYLDEVANDLIEALAEVD